MAFSNGNSWQAQTWVKITGAVLAALFTATIGLVITLLIRSSDERQRQIDAVPHELSAIMDTKLESLRAEIAATKLIVAETSSRDMTFLGENISRLQTKADRLSADIQQIKEHITHIRMWAERGGAGANGTPSPDPPPRR